MRLIPSAVRSSSRAESAVFQALEGLEVDGYDVAFHSLALAEHTYKRMGELDFVLVGSAGLLILEVKGGGVTRADGIWSYTGRHGTTLNSE